MPSDREIEAALAVWDVPWRWNVAYEPRPNPMLLKAALSAAATARPADGRDDQIQALYVGLREANERFAMWEAVAHGLYEACVEFFQFHGNPNTVHAMRAAMKAFEASLAPDALAATARPDWEITDAMVERLALRTFNNSVWVFQGYHGTEETNLWHRAAPDLREKYRARARADLEAVLGERASLSKGSGEAESQ